MIESWAAIAAVIGSTLWLVLLIGMLRQRPRAGKSFTPAERGFLAATLLLGILWTVLAPPWNAATVREESEQTVSGRCIRVHDGMSTAKVREVMKASPRVVAEEDVRGPGAAAWVYDDQRCIVHFIGDRVIGVEDEPAP